MTATLENPLLVRDDVTVAEYEAMPYEGHQYQLIHGKLIMSPSPSWKHQGCADERAGQFRDYLKSNTGGRYRTAMDVFLGPHVVQPDVLFVAKENRARITSKGVKGAPDLTVEVLSPSNSRQDTKIKMAIYEVFGVKEYWIVDPIRQNIKVYKLVDEEYAASTTIKVGTPLSTPLLPGFTLDTAEVFADN